MSRELGRLEDLPPQYVEDLRKLNLVPLWPSLRAVLPPNKPRPNTQPTCWSYEALRPLLMRAGELTPMEKAERRVLVLANPGHGLDNMKASPAIYLGMQLLLPGEWAPSHRHTPNAVRMVLDELESGTLLVVSNSMPVREVDAFLRASPRDLRVLGNRGASGIDGLLSTALGAAAAQAGPALLLCGDLAFLHDVGGLLAAHRHGLSLAIVVLDNDGGGIFSFLPQATALPGELFERFWGTPQAVDLAALTQLHGVGTRRARLAGQVADGLAWLGDQPGVAALVVQTDRAANVGVHEALNRAVAAALDG